MAQMLPEERATKFIATRKTLDMSTISASGVLWASYSPFVHHKGLFYVGVNYIAQHTKDLLETSKSCIFFRQDEQGAKNIYALERFAVNCSASVVVEASVEWNEVIPLFEEKFGDQFEFSRQLPDFYLFALLPVDQGRYVRGFALAYDVAPDFTDSVHVQSDHLDRGNTPASDNDKKK